MSSVCKENIEVLKFRELSVEVDKADKNFSPGEVVLVKRSKTQFAYGYVIKLHKVGCFLTLNADDEAPYLILFKHIFKLVTKVLLDKTPKQFAEEEKKSKPYPRIEWLEQTKVIPYIPDHYSSILKVGELINKKLMLCLTNKCITPFVPAIGSLVIVNLSNGFFRCAIFDGMAADRCKIYNSTKSFTKHPSNVYPLAFGKVMPVDMVQVITRPNLAVSPRILTRSEPIILKLKRNSFILAQYLTRWDTGTHEVFTGKQMIPVNARAIYPIL